MPETTTTFTAPCRLGAPSRAARSSARSRTSTTTHAAANTSVETRIATAAPVTSHRAPSTTTSGSSDERLDPVRDDPQPRPPDRHGQRLRPAEDEQDRGGDEHDPRRVDRRQVLAPEHDPTSHGIATRKTGTATASAAAAASE